MEGKVFSIPFRMRSALSDYSCRDGEIESLANATVVNPDTTGNGNAGISNPDDYPNPSVPETSPEISVSDYTVSLPPRPLIEFSLCRDMIPGWHNHPDRLPSKVMECDKPSAAAWGARVLDLLAALEKGAAASNLFTAPFFALCALRLNDGSHILPSPPVLLIPNSASPLVSFSSGLEASSMEMRTVIAACRLQYRLTIPETLPDWSDRVSHIDIFVTPQLSLYRKDISPTLYHNLSSTAFSHSTSSDGTTREHLISSETFAQGWLPEGLDDTEVSQGLLSLTGFRLISSIPLTEAVSSDTFTDVAFNRGKLSSLSTFEEYIPGFAHLCGISAASMATFSGRVTLCDLTLTLPEADPLAGLIPFSEGAAKAGSRRTALQVTARKDGEILKSYRLGMGSPDVEIDESCFPRWLFFPDPDASTISIITPTGSYTVPLVRHPHLHGAYFWCGGFGTATLTEMGVRHTGTALSTSSPDSLLRDSYHLPSAVWRSSKGNPLLYPDNLLMCLDVKRVIAICRAFRASGLVATVAPTAYLFTSEDIFLLKDTEDGTLRDAGLIGMYELRDPASLSISGNAVSFVTTAGETLRIEGTVIKGSVTADKTTATSAIAVIRGDGSGSPVEIVTRPLKLSGPEICKRISSVELLGNYTSAVTSLIVYGSNDLTNWHTLCTVSRGMVSGIWSPPVRFLKVSISLPLAPAETLEALILSLRS